MTQFYLFNYRLKPRAETAGTSRTAGGLFSVTTKSVFKLYNIWV